MDLRFGVQLGIIGLTFFMLINASALLVLAERKIMGFMQQRYGPYLVGPHGLLQPLADILKLLTRIENGEGEMRDIDLLVSVGNNIVGKTLCAFGDAAATPALTTVKNFRAEFEAHVREGRCTVPADWRAARPLVGAH